MEFYTLDANFQRVDVVDKVISAIWAERFSSSGDVNFVVEPTAAMRALLSEGTKIAIDDSDEIAIIENQLIEDGVLKASGRFLDQILDNRIIYVTSFNIPKAWPVTGTPGAIIQQIMQKFITAETEINLAGHLSQEIPNFSLGAFDVTGTSVTIGVPFGQLSAAIRQIAETYSLGYSLYLDSSSAPATYSLMFKVWKGVDRTSDQSTYETIEFSPNLDTLKDVKHLRSIAGYKNAVCIWASSLGEVAVLLGDGSWFENPAYVFSPGVTESTNGFDLRALYLEADDLVNSGGMAYYTTDARWKELRSAMEQRAKDALANNNYVKMIDGQVIFDNRWTYGVHYGLGDIVELSDYGVVQKARITEFIRSQDESGERAYPTVSVIE